MTSQQWYYAQLRWAVMVEGKEGLRAWKEAVHIFQSEDQETAFKQAMAIGRQGEDFHEEGQRTVETRLEQIVRLNCLGDNMTSFEISLGSRSARESLPFEYIFKPEEHMPESPL